MAKPNYQFEKRQKELEKKKKQEQKRLRKQAEHQTPGAGDAAEGPDGATLSSDSGDAASS